MIITCFEHNRCAAKIASILDFNAKDLTNHAKPAEQRMREFGVVLKNNGSNQHEHRTTVALRLE